MAKPCPSNMARPFVCASNGKSDTRTRNSLRVSKPPIDSTTSAAAKAVFGKTEAINGTQDYERHISIRYLTYFCHGRHLRLDAAGKKPIAGRGTVGKRKAGRVALFERRSAQHALFA